VLRRIFGPKRDEVTGGWRKLNNEELRDLYSSPSIIRIIKSRRMRWAGHVARMGGGIEYNEYAILGYFLLDFASTVIVGAGPRRTPDPIFQS
jgi:hypothetical protein